MDLSNLVKNSKQLSCRNAQATKKKKKKKKTTQKGSSKSSGIKLINKKKYSTKDLNLKEN